MRRFGWFLVALILSSAVVARAQIATIFNDVHQVVGCTINSVSLSNNSFVGGSPSGTTVGTVSSSTSGSCAANSFSITGTNASSFQLSGTTLETNGVVAVGSYSINLVNTISGATGSPLTQPETITGTSGYTGPGDIIAFTAWWGLRCYNAAYAGNVADVWDGSTGSTTETLITCSAGGTLVTSSPTALATTCAVSCRVKTLYDQTAGSVGNVSQATNSARPTYVQNCLNTSLPCMESTANTFELLGASFTPSAAKVTLSVVGSRVTGTQAPSFILENSVNGWLGSGGTANQWTLVGTSSNKTVAVTDGAWHSCGGVINGGSTIVNCDGTAGTGSTVASTAAGAPTVVKGPASSTVGVAEAGFIDNVAATSGNLTSLCHNQFGYWATATSC